MPEFFFGRIVGKYGQFGSVSSSSKPANFKNGFFAGAAAVPLPFEVSIFAETPFPELSPNKTSTIFEAFSIGKRLSPKLCSFLSYSSSSQLSSTCSSSSDEIGGSFYGILATISARLVFRFQTLCFGFRGCKFQVSHVEFRFSDLRTRFVNVFDFFILKIII